MDLKLIWHEQFRHGHHKIQFTLNDKPLVGLYKEGTEPIVYDAECDVMLWQHSWNLYRKTGKAFCYQSGMFMHQLILADSIHVSKNKADNRMANLTCFSPQLPIPELLNLGIRRYPQYLYWRDCFYIVEHPMASEKLLRCHIDGPVLAKYFRAMDVLAALNQQLKHRLDHEYEEIKKFLELAVMIHKI